jgi:hypothetical protein
MTLHWQKLSRQLNHPGSEFRGQLFWAWNGDLQPDELRRQIRIMQRMGLGGFFMHARMGLRTPYLGEQWFECVRASVDEAKQLGMQAWIYDEDQFPSGCAAGIATENSEYRMRRLELAVLGAGEALTWDDSVVAAFSAIVEKGQACRVQRLERGEKPRLEGGRSLLVFRRRIAGVDLNGVFRRQDNNIYGPMNVPYLDTLNPKAVKAFLDSTHEEYWKRYYSDFGGVIPGIFTDEPYYGEAFSPHYAKDDLRLPWTDALPEVFQKRYGYDLAGRLAELFFSVDGQAVSETRYHYYDCLTHLFVEAYAKQIGAWCGRAGVAFTGHVVFESLLSHQTHAVGSAMRFYEHMQIPGMDLLGMDREFDSAIQVASVARQFGRKRRLTETYGCTGWQLPFEAHKAIGDWQIALGINLRCLHLGFYSMEGESKRDYPASILHQSPWWECYSTVEDYFARVCAVMTQGEEVRDLLVISPVESAWAIMKPQWTRDAAIRKLDRSLVRVRDALLAGNIGFDYGDEDILSRHAMVSKTRGTARLKVGEASYTTVLLPPMLTIRSSTLKLLEDFVRAGGKVVVVGAAAAYVDARRSDAAIHAARAYENAAMNRDEIVRAVENCRRVSIADGDGRQIGPAMHLLREDAEAFYLFVCNYGVEFPASKLVWHKHKGPCPDPSPVRQRNYECKDVRIRLNGEFCSAIEVDCGDGKLYRARVDRAGGAPQIRTSLEKNGSRLFILPKRHAPLNLEHKADGGILSRRQLRADSYPIALSEANNLVLDCPEFRIDGGRWNGPADILRIDDAIRKRLGLESRGWMMRQPWQASLNSNGAGPRSVEVELRYPLHVSRVPSGDLHLALERPGAYEIAVNGSTLSTDACTGWWVDASLRKAPLPPRLLRVGDNEIRLRCRYGRDHSGLEAIYILGNFGVAMRNQDVTMGEPVSALALGDWTRQGLMFYSGSVMYQCPLEIRRKEMERYIITIAAHQGTAVRVWLNGRPVRVLGWAPWSAEITEHLDDASETHTLGVEIFGHRGNSHGPLHADRTTTLREGIGPLSFRKRGRHWKEEHQLIPCGLMQPPELTTLSRRGRLEDSFWVQPGLNESTRLSLPITYVQANQWQNNNETKTHTRNLSGTLPAEASKSR